jgi:hypothetical protein
MRKIKYSQALSEATVQSMERDPNIFMTGIAVDYPSGIFGSTTEATKRFPKRVFDAPAMENALTGIAIGAAAVGKRPIIVHPRNDFMFRLDKQRKWRQRRQRAHRGARGHRQGLGTGRQPLAEPAVGAGAFPGTECRDAGFSGRRQGPIALRAWRIARRQGRP